MSTEIYVAIISSGALSAAISAIVAAVNSGAKHKHGVAAGTRALLYDRIKFLSKHYIADGEIDAESLEDLIEMHRIYQEELGGNGYLDTLICQVKHLHIKAKG